MNHMPNTALLPAAVTWRLACCWRRRSVCVALACGRQEQREVSDSGQAGGSRCKPRPAREHAHLGFQGLQLALQRQVGRVQLPPFGLLGIHLALQAHRVDLQVLAGQQSVQTRLPLRVGPVEHPPPPAPFLAAVGPAGRPTFAPARPALGPRPHAGHSAPCRRDSRSKPGNDQPRSAQRSHDR